MFPTIPNRNYIKMSDNPNIVFTLTIFGNTHSSIYILCFKAKFLA